MQASQQLSSSFGEIGGESEECGRKWAEKEESH